MSPMVVLRSSRVLAGVIALALGLVLPGAARAQQHAHAHGHLDLEVAVDASSMTLHLESPLDNFLGFERVPRTDAERQRVADMLARLRAADELFEPDPDAACKLSTVAVESAVLGLAGDGSHREEPGHGRDGAHRHDGEHGHGEHADIDVTIAFDCAAVNAARFIDVGLFEAFGSLRSITAWIVSPQGQFKRDLRPGSSRLRWGD